MNTGFNGGSSSWEVTDPGRGAADGPQGTDQPHCCQWLRNRRFILPRYIVKCSFTSTLRQFVFREQALPRNGYINQRNYNTSILWSFFISVFNVKQCSVLEV